MSENRMSVIPDKSKNCLKKHDIGQIFETLYVDVLRKPVRVEMK